MTVVEVHHLVDQRSKLTAPATTQPKDFVWSSPCILVGFFYDPAVSNHQSRSVAFDHQWALLDTGADGVYVDESLIRKFNCPVADGGENMTVNAQEGSKAHLGSLFILEGKRVIDMWVMARDFRKENRPFNIVLGRRFLQFCELRWSGPRQTVELTIGENAAAY